MADLPGGEVVVYETANDETRVDVRLDRDTVLLRKEQMGQLLGRERSVITKHIGNVFGEGELEPGWEDLSGRALVGGGCRHEGKPTTTRPAELFCAVLTRGPS